LRNEFGTALVSEEIVSRPPAVPGLENLGASKPVAGQPAAVEPTPETAAKDPFIEQQRLAHSANQGDVQRVEYELFRTRVYRVRWRFAKRFERPLMDSLVASLTADLGKPYYDQMIKAKFASGRATLRRAGWRNGDQTLEIRQLNPLVGGPLYMTLSDQAAIKTIVGAGGTAAPEPDSIGRWWTEPIEMHSPLTGKEQRALVDAFEVVRSGVEWDH